MFVREFHVLALIVSAAALAAPASAEDRHRVQLKVGVGGVLPSESGETQQTHPLTSHRLFDPTGRGRPAKARWSDLRRAQNN